MSLIHAQITFSELCHHRQSYIMKWKLFCNESCSRFLTLYVCQNSPRYPSSPFGLFRGALMPTHKKRKEAEKHFLLDLSHNSTFLYAVQISYCWMCANNLPEQPQYFLIDSIFCCPTWTRPVIRALRGPSQRGMLEALQLILTLPRGTWQECNCFAAF